ncbi:hypothetical protein BCV70DRAFT_202240 [Testicularia cyperi]|uniref:DUF1771-domain-containing protein n=1 Tax=Testicularia cyperi TaxID=1882483 RepID=A0A317XKW0_9BASI|nr:hypothetical protein BCV70DRAFT_202240 [Testicularia cyperi]
MSQRSGSHAKIFLDSLFSSSSSRNSSSGPQTPASTTVFSSAGANSASAGPHLTPAFRPHKPSSLSSSASASASEDGVADRESLTLESKPRPPPSSDGIESDDDNSMAAASPPFSSSFKAAQLSMQALSQTHRAPSNPSSRRTSTSAAATPSATSSDSVAELLSILNNELIDEEDRIDKVRATLAAALYTQEGVISPPSRIDGLVLDLMHRHREDLHPTGAIFSALPHQSPSRRPASIRSFSSSRPWTPSRPPFSASSSFNISTDATPMAVAAQPNSPLFGSAALASVAPAPTPVQASASSVSSNPAQSPRPHPGVIGSGSPRASPRLWNRTLSNLSTTSIASSTTQASGVGVTLSSPHISGPAGILGAPSSRPASPSPFGSPRLNIAATEFKPRNTSSTSLASTSALTPSKPTPLLMRRPSSNASSSNLALANKSHAAAGEDDDDEFSPFGSARPAPAQAHSSYHDPSAELGDDGLANNGAPWTSGWAQSGPSYSLGPSSVPFHTGNGSEDARPESSAPMTPFDMLYSILVTGTKAGSSEWSPEQVDEALVMHQYDVEATLNAIWENDGKPLGDGSKSSLSGPVLRQASGVDSPRPAAAALPATAAVKAGVNVLPREALTLSGRGGRFAGRSGHGPTGHAADGNGAPSAVAGGSGHRVCRFFLAGECRRSDCRFSHDLENRAVCRYWLKGQCAHNPCNFLHDYDALNQLANGIVSGLHVEESSQRSEMPPRVEPSDSPASTPHSQEDFPELGVTPKSSAKGSYAAATLGAGSGNAATQNRWAATVQKKAPTDVLSQVQKDPAGVISIHAKAGPSRPPASSVSPKPSSSKAAGAASASRPSARIPLRPPMLLPTLLTGKLAAQAYQAHRNGSLTLAEQRNKLLARASEAYRKGDVASAKKYSKEASSLNHQYEDESRVASRDLLKQRLQELRARINDPHASGSSAANQSDEAGARGLRGKAVGNGLGVCLGVARPSSLAASSAASLSSQLSIDERSECLLDLHGLHSKEAVEITEEFLLGLESEGIQGLAYLAVGKEKHSSRDSDRRRVKIAAFIKQFLASYAYPFAESDGIIVVDHLSHT